MSVLDETKGNYSYLLIGLVTMLLATALAQQFSGIGSRILIPVIAVLALGISIFSVGNPRLFRIGLGIVLIAMISALASIYSIFPNMVFLELICLGVFYIGMAVSVLRRVLFSGPIDNNKIIGAICIYLLIGMIWTVMFSFAFELSPGAFNNINGQDWSAQFSELIYFSFVTLSTLGFGDISPATPLTRFLVYMEALTGQFYLAILVASLIGARFSSNRSEEK